MKRRLVSTCLLWIAVLLVGIQSAHAQDGLIVGAGSTVTVNSATLDMNCLTIRIKAQGSLNLGSGTIADSGEVIVETDGTFNQGTGTIVYCPGAPPEISIHENQNGTLIPHQGTYNLGTVGVGAFMLLEFTISNTGPTNLLLTGSPNLVALSGPQAGDFQVVAWPNSPVLPGGSTTFIILFTCGGNDSRSVTVTIANNDSDEAPYIFNIVANQPMTNNYLLWTK